LYTFGGTIALDPCSNAESIVPAQTKFCLPVDGLRQDWSVFDNAYINPPFGRDKKRRTSIYHWVNKAKTELKEAIFLIPAAVDTRHWQSLILNSPCQICLISGRVKFNGAKASAPMACALVHFGLGRKNYDRFDEYFSEWGTVIEISS
jgi:hypothetical protein